MSLKTSDLGQFLTVKILVRKFFGSDHSVLAPTTYPPDVREKKFLFTNAWAIAEAYVGFCVGFIYSPDPAVKTRTSFDKTVARALVDSKFNNVEKK